MTNASCVGVADDDDDDEASTPKLSISKQCGVLFMHNAIIPISAVSDEQMTQTSVGLRKRNN